MEPATFRRSSDSSTPTGSDMRMGARIAYSHSHLAIRR
jgi:hypothetical protein